MQERIFAAFSILCAIAAVIGCVIVAVGMCE